MKDAHFHERRFHGGTDILRSPERMALLQVDRVAAMSVEALDVKTVLDVGTGTAVFAEVFSNMKFDVTGIDVNTGFFKEAKRFAPSVRFLEGAAEKLPFQDSAFDLIFLGHVLHETDQPLLALKEAKRVALQRVVVLEWPYRDEEQGPPLWHRLKPEKIMEVARKAGFSSVERHKLDHMDLYRLTAQ